MERSGIHTKKQGNKLRDTSKASSPAKGIKYAFRKSLLPSNEISLPPLLQLENILLTAEKLPFSPLRPAWKALSLPHFNGKSSPQKTPEHPQNISSKLTSLIRSWQLALTASHSYLSTLPCSCRPQRFSAFSAERNLHVSSSHSLLNSTICFYDHQPQGDTWPYGTATLGKNGCRKWYPNGGLQYSFRLYLFGLVFFFFSTYCFYFQTQL